MPLTRSSWFRNPPDHSSPLPSLQSSPYPNQRSIHLSLPPHWYSHHFSLHKHPKYLEEPCRALPPQQGLHHLVSGPELDCRICSSASLQKRIFFAAVSAAINALNSWFSSLRCSVASTTDSSSSLMPFSKALISSVKVSIASFAFAIAVSASFSARSRDFFLSSARSNCFSQYSFLSLSSCCSCFSSATKSSHMRMTLSNIPWLRPFFPVKANTKKSSPGR